MKGNKGEWSELYAHFRLLGDGFLYPSDNNGKQDRNFGSPIVQIMRKESKDDSDNLFIVDNAKKLISFKSQTKEIVVPQETFATVADKLLQGLKASKKDDVSISDIEEITQNLEITQLKASSSRKEDIRMVLHNLLTGRDKEVGFSIKSKLGGQSTLVNANKDGTNLVFEITGGITDEQLAELNSMSDTKEKRRGGFFGKWFNKLAEWGYSVEFSKVANEIFESNLQFIDLSFEKVLAQALLAYYGHKANSSRLADIMQIVANCNPCGVNELIRTDWYTATMKRFLINFALGMTPNKLWDNKMQANGGYIVVREDGDIVAYHFYEITQLGNYLFENTAFDTPSTSRHNFHQVFRGTDGKAYMKLNPQIRFVHAK